MSVKIERRRFDKAAAKECRHLRREWVPLDAGDVCVVEMTAQAATTLSERASRPSIDPRGGLDPGESVLWQILLSTFYDDGAEAEPVFSETPADVKLIMDLRFEEFQALIQAINRVNGRDATEAEVMRDFSRVSEAMPTSR